MLLLNVDSGPKKPKPPKKGKIRNVLSEEEKTDHTKNLSFNSRAGLMLKNEESGLDTIQNRISLPSDRFSSVNQTEDHGILSFDVASPKKIDETSKDYKITIHQEVLNDINESGGEFKVMLGSGEPIQTVNLPFFIWDNFVRSII